MSTRRRSTGIGSRVCVRSGSATFSATVRSVSRPLPCSSTPTLRRISRSALLPVGMGWPNRVMLPVAGRSSPVSAASSVDLPLPDGPSTAVMLPRGTDSETSRRIARPPRSMRTLLNCTNGSWEAVMDAINNFPTF